MTDDIGSHMIEILRYFNGGKYNSGSLGHVISCQQQRQ